MKGRFMGPREGGKGRFMGPPSTTGTATHKGSNTGLQHARLKHRGGNTQGLRDPDAQGQCRRAYWGGSQHQFTAAAGEDIHLRHGGLVHCALDRVAPGVGSGSCSGGSTGVTGVTGCLVQQAALMGAAESPGAVLCPGGLLLALQVAPGSEA